MIQFIRNEEKIFSIIIPSDHSEEDTNFVSPEEHPQQVGYMKKPEGHSISAHRHLKRERQIEKTQETLFVRSGRVLIELFDNDREVLEETILTDGDVIVFVDGGHSLEMLEETELVVAKQGPYKGKEEDKEVFEKEETS